MQGVICKLHRAVHTSTPRIHLLAGRVGGSKGGYSPCVRMGSRLNWLHSVQVLNISTTCR